MQTVTNDLQTLHLAQYVPDSVTKCASLSIINIGVVALREFEALVVTFFQKAENINVYC